MNDPTGQTAFTAKHLTAKDKIIAVQRECEEVCLQSDTPDYRALYFKLFALTEELRLLLDPLP